jgi:putative hemolysin
MTGIDVVLLAAAVALVAVASLLTAAEVAVSRVSRVRAHGLADDGRRGSRSLVNLVDREPVVVSPLRLASLACLLLQTTLVAILAHRAFEVPVVVVLTVLNIGAVFVLAEAVPRLVVSHNTENWALRLAPIARAVVVLTGLRPLTRWLVRLARLLVPGAGAVEPKARGPHSGGVQLGRDEGLIEQDPNELVESIIDFGDTVVREVMIPRPDMITVEADFRVADVMEVMLLNGYSRLPVCGNGIDDIVGLVYAKDLMRAERDGKEQESVREFLRRAMFVPETKRLPELLREMQQHQFHMAIVLDEYGGTSGLVTLEDIMEELVGEIADEYDVEDPMIEPLAGGDFLARGRTSLDEVNELLNAGLPEGDWDTVGGLVYSRLGHVPTEGEAVTIGEWTLTAQRIQGRRIARVRISPPRLGNEAATSDAPDSSDSAADAAAGDPTPANGSIDR